MGLFTIDSIRDALAGAPFIEQAVLSLEMLLGIALLGRSLRARSLRHLSAQRQTAWLTGLRASTGLVMLTFAVALGASVLGHMRLARLLASGAIGSSVLALMLYANVHVLVGVVAVALRVWPLHLLGMVRHHREMLERRTYRVLMLAASLG